MGKKVSKSCGLLSYLCFSPVILMLQLKTINQTYKLKIPTNIFFTTLISQRVDTDVWLQLLLVRAVFWDLVVFMWRLR